MPPKLPAPWAAARRATVITSRSPPSIHQAPTFLLPLTSIRGVKNGWSTLPKHDKSSHKYNNSGPYLPTLSHSPAAARARKLLHDSLPLRTGAIGIKKGMTALYDPETGKRTPCTVLQLDRVQVVSHKTVDKHGYFAVHVGSGWKHPSNVTKPLLGHYEAAGVSPKRHVAEFKVRDERGLLDVGALIGADWFVEGQFVDARSNCRGFGFAGGMKKWGFKGQPASHGNSKNHRTMGSSGGSQGSGSRVHPGKKMPGRMGGQQVTVQNLQVLKVDPESGVVVVSGPVAGPKGAIVKIQDAIKKPWPDAPMTVSVGGSKALPLDAEIPPPAANVEATA